MNIKIKETTQPTNIELFFTLPVILMNLFIVGWFSGSTNISHHTKKDSQHKVVKNRRMF